MSRRANVTISFEDMEAINQGWPIKVKCLSGSQRFIELRSLKNINRKAYDEHVCELTVGKDTVRLHVSDLMEALNAV